LANFCHHCGTATSQPTHTATTQSSVKVSSKAKVKRAPSAYNKKYSAAFKKVAPRFKKKNGGWVKDGFKRAGAAARKMIK